MDALQGLLLGKCEDILSGSNFIRFLKKFPGLFASGNFFNC
jgi:hypothetical protein